MKTAIIICDGGADNPIPALGHRTPFDAAFLPHVHYLASRGRLLCLQTTYNDLPVESIVAALGILGYPPHEYFPNGRSSFEALASGISVGHEDVAFRCNLISLDEDRISDFTAGMINDTIANNLILSITLGHRDFQLYPGQSYRNTLVWRGLGLDATEFECAPPHQHLGEVIEGLWVSGRSAKAQEAAGHLNEFLRSSRQQLAGLNVDYESKANILWLWSPSNAPSLPSFHSRYGVRGGIVSGLHFLKGIGIAARMLAPDVVGATGYVDTNLDAKTEAAKNLFERVDLVVIHVNAADEESHQHSVTGKVRSLELIDEKVVGPLAQHLRHRYPGGHRLVFLPDHYTCLADGRHSTEPIPCLVYGTGVQPDSRIMFSEAACVDPETPRMDASELMSILLSETLSDSSFRRRPR